ncbi:hypothetical protein B0H63DRAFT_449415 [Podospora didyma]|uniref:Uncharacterized protein n=1 Tax=Podospora didyma TaxID=330526 RepID=A0AAE0NPP9_9PEZI|nr:hypothetical protein B0H63DRAFT_449415 [Podospora didyma]
MTWNYYQARIHQLPPLTLDQALEDAATPAETMNYTADNGRSRYLIRRRDDTMENLAFVNSDCRQLVRTYQFRIVDLHTLRLTIIEQLVEQKWGSSAILALLEKEAAERASSPEGLTQKPSLCACIQAMSIRMDKKLIHRAIRILPTLPHLKMLEYEDYGGMSASEMVSFIHAGAASTVRNLGFDSRLGPLTSIKFGPDPLFEPLQVEPDGSEEPRRIRGPLPIISADLPNLQVLSISGDMRLSKECAKSLILGSRRLSHFKFNPHDPALSEALNLCEPLLELRDIIWNRGRFDIDFDTPPADIYTSANYLKHVAPYLESFVTWDDIALWDSQQYWTSLIRSAVFALASSQWTIPLRALSLQRGNGGFPEDMFEAISTFCNLEELSLMAHNSYTGFGGVVYLGLWHIDHQDLRKKLKGLQKLRTLIIINDTYRREETAPAHVAFMDGQAEMYFETFKNLERIYIGRVEYEAFSETVQDGKIQGPDIQGRETQGREIKATRRGARRVPSS